MKTLTHTTFLLITFLLLSCGSSKNYQGAKTRTYRLNVIPSKSSIHFPLGQTLSIKGGVQYFTLPAWNNCEESFVKGPFSKCTTIQLNQYFNSNLQIPEEALSNSLEGYTNVKFTIDKEGKIGKATIVKEPGGGIGPEMQRLVEALPQWKAAQINDGTTITTEMEMEVFFDLVLR